MSCCRRHSRTKHKLLYMYMYLVHVHACMSIPYVPVRPCEHISVLARMCLYPYPGTDRLLPLYIGATYDVHPLCVHVGKSLPVLAHNKL